MKRQRGAALVMVMLAVALISVIAVHMNEQVSYHLKRHAQSRDLTQAYWYARGAEQLATALIRDARGQSHLHLNQAWASRAAVFPLDEGVMRGQVADLSACFNVNALVQPETEPGSQPSPHPPRQRFLRLLSLLGHEADLAEQLADRINDWADNDLQPEGPYGAEDLTFSALSTPYQPPNQSLVDISELELAVPERAGISDRLKPWLCTRPSTDGRLNINTLPTDKAQLLAAFLNTSTDEASRLLLARPDEGWTSVDALLAEPLLVDREPAVDGAGLTVTSDHFQVTVEVRYRDSALLLRSLVAADGSDVVVFAREYGDLL